MRELPDAPFAALPGPLMSVAFDDLLRRRVITPRDIDAQDTPPLASIHPGSTPAQHRDIRAHGERERPPIPATQNSERRRLAKLTRRRLHFVSHYVAAQ